MAPALALVVLAAGVGSRFGGMKQLAPVSAAGHALMDYAIYDALQAGFERVVFVVSERTADAVRAHAQAGCARRVDARFARQAQGDRRTPWGTGHAVLSARSAVDGPFGVINADDFYGRQSFVTLGENLSRHTNEHLLVGYTLRETLSPFGGVSRGLCLLDGDHLSSVVELHDVRSVDLGFTSRESEWRRLTGDEVVSTNLWGFQPSFFDVLDEAFSIFIGRHASEAEAEFLIGTAVNSLERRDGSAVRVLRTPEQFFGVTFPEDLPSARQLIADRIGQGRYPARLWE